MVKKQSIYIVSNDGSVSSFFASTDKIKALLVLGYRVIVRSTDQEGCLVNGQVMYIPVLEETEDSVDTFMLGIRDYEVPEHSGEE